MKQEEDGRRRRRPAQSWPSRQTGTAGYWCDLAAISSIQSMIGRYSTCWDTGAIQHNGPSRIGQTRGRKLFFAPASSADGSLQ